MYTQNQEIERRRTFAIISHPDAGKTTLTEKLLLYGGAIREAGSVKGRKTKKYAVSDWMEIEKQRGISVTSSVLNFDYNGHRINILDTPGHQDFSEDAYRTLVAADSAVMLLDGAKGVETQTRKLFHVCKMRGIPIFTFINKMDRHSKNPFDLIEELEYTLGIASCPVTWPLRCNGEFRGVYNRLLKTLELFDQDGQHGSKKLSSQVLGLDDPTIDELVGAEAAKLLREEVELLDVAGEEFDLEKITAGELTPVFFGSAMTNFGVGQFLEDFISMAPMPTPRTGINGEEINPSSDSFSGFVFKIQANMDPKHRDRLAFIRICSGRYEKGMSVFNHRINKQIRLSQPQQFMAQDRDIIPEAYSGDVIGVFDSGTFHLGDSLYEGDAVEFPPIPMFPAEFFAFVSPKDVGKRKQFNKGIEQLLVEGAIQVFKTEGSAADRIIVGVAGVLQLDVLAYRMQGEYGVEVRVESASYTHARWISPQGAKPDIYLYSSDTIKANDIYGREVYLFSSPYTLQRAIEKNEDMEFLDIAPHTLY